MKNNLVRILAVIFISVGISKADVFEEMFEKLTKDKVANSLGGLGEAGSRSKEDVMQVINANTPDLKKIYNQYLKQNPGFGGKVTIKFTIDASGKIIDIKIISSTTGNVKFDKAIKDNVATWKWKAIKSGNTTPTIPFSFSEEDESWNI
jgi:TonB family protein